MHYRLWLLTIFGIVAFAFLSFSETNAVININSQAPQESKSYNILESQQIQTAEKVEQDAYQNHEADIQSKIDTLQASISAESTEANLAHETFEQSRSRFLARKNLLKDPWRAIYNDKKFVISADSSFVEFNGQILEVADQGIRMLGQFGGSTQTQYFLINFPYRVKAGESIDPTRIYMAFEDGTFSYVSEDGYAVSLPKLNYGTPCDRPAQADEVEQSAQESQLQAAEQDASNKDLVLDNAKKQIQNETTELAAIRKEAAEHLQMAVEEGLKYDLAYAERRDLDALHRMVERYQDGDGVKVDTNKAAEYGRIYQETFQTETERIQAQNLLANQDELRQKFLKNLFLSDNYDNVESTLYVEQCYRYGNGVEKDLSKADLYHAKAVSLGLPQPNSTGRPY